jgi:DNA-binding NtrC family response regulator
VFWDTLPPMHAWGAWSVRRLSRTAARVTTTTTLRHATILVENDGLSAAVLDHGLGDGDSSPLCERLTERNIPFLIYSGFGSIDEGACHEAPHVSKPASPEMLVATVAGYSNTGQFHTEKRRRDYTQKSGRKAA